MRQKRSPAKRVFRILGYFLLFVTIILCAIVTYIKAALPDIGGPPELHVRLTPEKIERGRYLANCVCVCMDCHSQRDWTKYAGPLKDGTYGMGGERFDQTAGFPGVYFSKNITPSGIARYTDGELFRVITTGVNHGKIIIEKAFTGGREFIFPNGTSAVSANITFDDQSKLRNWTQEMFVRKFRFYADSSYHPNTLLPSARNTVMPWMMYSKMNERDLKAIYTYLKSLGSSKTKV